MNWLSKARKEKKMTQKELAKATGINIFTIQNIEQGTRKGSEEIVNKLKSYFENDSINVSYDCEELIEELKMDIEEFGKDHYMYAMFENIDNKIFLTNYDFITEEKPLTDEEKEEFALILQLKANDILKILEIQNNVVR